jgi:hypothetical protein
MRSDGLRNVPSWDQILTRENEKMWGVIPEDVFVCTLIDGKKYSIPYKEIISISVNRQGFFSDRDYVQITRTDGTVDHRKAFLVQALRRAQRNVAARSGSASMGRTVIRASRAYSCFPG